MFHSRAFKLAGSQILALGLGLLGLVPLAQAQGFSDGAVYTSTNELAGNQVAIFARAADGTATFQQFVPTGGLGADGGLGSQGAVTLSDDGRYLYVVNAGSDDLSVFRVRDDGLDLIDVVDSRGQRPVSVAQHDDRVFVVNAGDSRIAGFRQLADGSLKKLGGHPRLSTPSAGPAQIDFSNDGRYLYVTEKATNSITRFRLSKNGTALEAVTMASAGPTPFGFHVGQRQQLIVSEAAGGAAGASTVSSYEIDAGNGMLGAISASVPSNETAVCWVVGTPDGRLAFASNTGTDSVSSFDVAFDGTLTLLDAQAANTGDAPTDMALTADGLFFYVLNSADGTLGAYAVEPDGSLTDLPGLPGGLTTFAAGLTAR